MTESRGKCVNVSDVCGSVCCTPGDVTLRSSNATFNKCNRYQRQTATCWIRLRLLQWKHRSSFRRVLTETRLPVKRSPPKLHRSILVFRQLTQ